MSWWKVVKRAWWETLSGFGYYPFKWARCCTPYVVAVVLVWSLWDRKGKGAALTEFFDIILPTFSAVGMLFFAVFLGNLVLIPFKILYEKIEAYNSTGQPQGSSKIDQILNDMAELAGIIEEYKNFQEHIPNYHGDPYPKIIRLKTQYCMWFPDNMLIDKIFDRTRDVIRALSEHGYAKANEILLESAKDWGENARS